MERTIAIFVNGILTMPGDSRNWTGRAVTWAHTRGRAVFAEKVEYFVGPVGRSLRQKKRAQKLCRTLSFYLHSGWKIVLAGHSNGCDVILDALALASFPEIAEIHLVSGACHADCVKSGLNRVIADRKVVYIAGNDWALKLAATPIGRVLGYGVLGSEGPTNFNGNIEVVLEPQFGHGTWFASEHFDHTMRRLLSQN